MVTQRFKSFTPHLPRGLYGRAALVLVLPILLLQLVVSVLFIQRDLEDITQQMTYTVVRELRLLQEVVAREQSQAAALAAMAPVLEPLNLRIRFLEAGEPVPPEFLRWGEFSGHVIKKTLNNNLPGFETLQLPSNKLARITFQSDLGTLFVEVNRRRMSPAAPHQLIVTVVVCGFLFTLISFVFMRNQLRPIKRLANAAEAFGRGRMIPYVPRGALEVRAAGAAFLNMRARIERQIEQRTLMLSGVSHDLRTPLTRMKLALAFLDEEEANPLLQDVAEMEALVNSFLEFSRGVQASEMETCDPEALIRGVVDKWQQQDKAVRIVQVSGVRIVPLRRAAVRRAMDNLISNAIRYGSCARVSLTMTQKSLRLRVEDDGPGIPPEARGDALRPFVRLDPARNQDRGSGVGLGLAIVADIARAHGGTLRLGTSDELGGLQADIVIPL